jgi:ectoine hydroxylase-related dioxygenase (phytanoyl-CoA dioxygenase family)
VECHGGPGDIVFWHHRIGHAAGPNTSRQIRQAVLYDFRKTDLDRTQEEPPAADMWRDWSAELRAAETNA